MCAYILNYMLIAYYMSEVVYKRCVILWYHTTERIVHRYTGIHWYVKLERWVAGEREGWWIYVMHKMQNLRHFETIYLSTAYSLYNVWPLFTKCIIVLYLVLTRSTVLTSPDESYSLVHFCVMCYPFHLESSVYIKKD